MELSGSSEVARLRSMRRLAVVVLGLIGVATLGHPLAGAVTAPSGIDPRLRLEWEVREGRDGRPVITGYIHNDYGRPAINVRLLSVAVDASGEVVDTAVVYVSGGVPAFNRSYFDVALRKAGADYRVTVTSFDWKESSF